MIDAGAIQVGLGGGLHFVRRTARHLAVWLGEKKSASFAAPSLGRFPATATKEKDFVLDLPARG